MSAGVRIEVSSGEARYLGELVEQYLELVAAPPAGDDPALARLSPDAYPDEPGESAEFRRLTVDDLSAVRAAEARLVLVSLRPATLDGPDDERTQPDEPDDDDNDDDDASIRTIVADAELQTAWLRTLAGLRLVLATRIGIVDDTSSTRPGDPRADVYEWLGYRQEMLLQRMDTDDDR